MPTVAVEFRWLLFLALMPVAEPWDPWESANPPCQFAMCGPLRNLRAPPFFPPCPFIFFFFFFFVLFYDAGFPEHPAWATAAAAAAAAVEAVAPQVDPGWQRRCLCVCSRSIQTWMQIVGLRLGFFILAHWSFFQLKKNVSCSLA